MTAPAPQRAVPERAVPQRSFTDRLRPAALPLLLAPGAGYLALFFGFPLILALLGGFGLFTIGAESRFTLDNYRELFTNRTYWDGLRFSLYLAVAPTLVSLAISLPLAVVLQSTFPGRKIFSALNKVPLAVPSIVAAFIVMTLFDRGGMLTRVLAPVGLSAPRMVRDEWALGVIVAMSWKNIPFMTLIIGGSVAAISKDVLAAARSLGAGKLRVFWEVQMPLALPGVTAATLLVFIGSMGAFAVPNLLGPIYPLPLSVHMFENAYEENQWGMVSAMGTLLSAVAVAVLLAYYRLTRGARRAYGSLK